MQFALSNAVNRVIPIPLPLRFNHPGSANFPPVPDFRVAYHSHFVDKFDKIEVEIQNTIMEQEAKGARPPEKQRPWSHYPFGRRTRSQEQYAKRHAQREEHLEQKRQEKSREVLVSAAVQAALSPTTLHRPTYVQTWLTDNPGYTEKHFWERQVAQRNYPHVPLYVIDAHHPPLDNDPERYQDAQE